MGTIRITWVFLAVCIAFGFTGPPTAGEQPGRPPEKPPRVGIFFSTEEDFVTRHHKPRDGNLIISDGDLLDSTGYVYARNHELLYRFKTKFDLGLDAADVLRAQERYYNPEVDRVAFSTELDHPQGLFTAGDLLATNGAILPNFVLLAAFEIPRELDLGLDAVHFVGKKEAAIQFLEEVRERDRKAWMAEPRTLIQYLKRYQVDIWFSTEGTAPVPKSPRFLDGDLLSAATGMIVLKNFDALPPMVPAGIPTRGVDFGMDAVTMRQVSASGAPPSTINFDDLPLSKEYSVGDAFGPATVKPFQWANGDTTDRGHAKVVDAGKAGGSGKEIFTNNSNLSFDFGGPCEGLTLLFAKSGGNLNIDVNGDFRNINAFSQIHGMNIGGVSVEVHGDAQGSIKLTGTITSFAIGGQELWVDDVCPMPAAQRLLFSTEILFKRQPTFTDGDALRKGDGIALLNWDLVAQFEPRTRDLGLDALSFHPAPIKTCSFTKVGGVDVNWSTWDFATGYADPTLSGHKDHAFGRWVSIRGVLSPDTVQHRVLYRPEGGADTPILMPPGLGGPQGWRVFCHPASFWIPVTITGDGWMSTSFWKFLRDACMNPDLILVNWRTSTVTTPDGKYTLTLQCKDGDANVKICDELTIQIDNTRPDVKLDGTHECKEYGPADMPMRIKGAIRDEVGGDGHFRNYSLILDAFWIPPTPFAQGHYTDGPPLNAYGTLSYPGFDELGQLDIPALLGKKAKGGRYTVLLHAWDRSLLGGFTPKTNFVNDGQGHNRRYAITNFEFYP